MKQFPMKKIAVAVSAACVVLASVPVFAEGEKIQIKISAPKESLANDKAAKKIIKAVPWTPCVAAETTYGKLGGKDEKKISGVDVKDSVGSGNKFADKLKFDISLGNKSGNYNAYFFLAAPAQSIIHYASVTQFTTVGTGTGKARKVTGVTPTTLSKPLFNILAFTSYKDPKTIKPTDGKFEVFVKPYLNLDKSAVLAKSGGVKKASIVLNLDTQYKLFHDYKKDYSYGVNNIVNPTSMAQGAWLAVAVMTPQNISNEGLTNPASWLAFDVQPFVLGHPLTDLTEDDTPQVCK